ncbi:MAG: hypothetical protein KF757_08125 [Phycisphaeraceae bacterium]|nr:hypothetical protein [Phycisphaeraceae bacterium]MCW5762722.1 hypothetical protein [Phycisphaeraceae bacterium]
MWSRLLNLYQRKRIVNINVNVVVAGFLAIIIAKYPVLLATQWIGSEHKLVNAFVAAAIDAVADVIIYFILHWLANHCRQPKGRPVGPGRSFWRDASLIQFERLMLTPAFYVIAIGGMWGLQHAGIQPSWSFVYSFGAAILLTRIIHTFWGLRTGRFRDVLSETAQHPPKT